MKTILINNSAYDWFQRLRKVKKKGKVIAIMSESETLTRLMNWWETMPKDQRPKFYRSV